MCAVDGRVPTLPGLSLGWIQLYYTIKKSVCKYAHRFFH